MKASHDVRLVGLRRFATLVRHDFRSAHDAFIVITVVIIKWVLRATGLVWQSDVRPRTPLDTLKDRFTRADIDRAEFEERKQLLSGS
jgi:hypothetical protein